MTITPADERIELALGDIDTLVSELSKVRLTLQTTVATSTALAIGALPPMARAPCGSRCATAPPQERQPSGSTISMAASARERNGDRAFREIEPQAA